MSVSPEITALWETYLAEEKSGVRSHALALLENFITRLRAQSETDWQNWAADLSREVVDDHHDIPVRFPLFRSVIFPALHNRLNAGSGAAARWLAGFNLLLYHSCECRDQLPEHLQTEYGLILEAIRRDRLDLGSKQRLRTIFRRRFDYSLHELPSGILYGQDGATIEQCTELIEELAQYVSLCEEIGAEDSDREMIKEASFYIPAYRDYLTHGRSYGSFAKYLDAHDRRSGE